MIQSSCILRNRTNEGCQSRILYKILRVHCISEEKQSEGKPLMNCNQERVVGSGNSLYTRYHCMLISESEKQSSQLSACDRDNARILPSFAAASHNTRNCITLTYVYKNI